MFQGKWYVDGNVVHAFEGPAAIERCKELGVTDERNIILDIILLTPLTEDLVGQKALPIKDKATKDLVALLQAHPNVNYRYLMAPPFNLECGYDLLNLDGSYT